MKKTLKLEDFIKNSFREVKSTEGNMFSDWTIVTVFAATGLQGVEVREIEITHTIRLMFTLFASQVLELAAENAECYDDYENNGDGDWVVDKQSIIDTLKQVE